MTSLPILWYCIFDFQHKRDIPMQMELPKKELAGYFLRNPLLFRIGIEGSCFSTFLFTRWLLYALAHAFFVFCCCFYVMAQYSTHQSDGKDIGFWVSGMLVYGVCIFVANGVLAFKQYTHTWMGTFFYILCASSYFFFYWLFSVTFKNEIAHLFIPTFSMRVCYVIFFYICGTVYLLELAWSALKHWWKPEIDYEEENEELLNN
jgi:hypothetical protein